MNEMSVNDCEMSIHFLMRANFVGLNVVYRSVCNHNVNNTSHWSDQGDRSSNRRHHV